MPDIDATMSAHRSTGTWCITVRNTHQAWKFSPLVTVPGAPAAARAWRTPRSRGNRQYD